MMVLTGNVGKSVVLQSLVETHNDIYALVYDESSIQTVETLYISSNYFGIEELCDNIRRDICSESGRKELVVIYTNLHESNTSAIKDLIEELEQDGFCRYGIVMCRE